MNTRSYIITMVLLLITVNLAVANNKVIFREGYRLNISLDVDYPVAIESFSYPDVRICLAPNLHNLNTDIPLTVKDKTDNEKEYLTQNLRFSKFETQCINIAITESMILKYGFNSTIITVIDDSETVHMDIVNSTSGDGLYNERQINGKYVGESGVSGNMADNRWVVRYNTSEIPDDSTIQTIVLNYTINSDNQPYYLYDLTHEPISTKNETLAEDCRNGTLINQSNGGTLSVNMSIESSHLQELLTEDWWAFCIVGNEDSGSEFGAEVNVNWQLEITYDDGESSPYYSSNSTNSTTAGTDILHSLLWQDGKNMSYYTFQFCNGTWNGSECFGIPAVPDLSEVIIDFESGSFNENVTYYESDVAGRQTFSGTYKRSGTYGMMLDRNPSGDYTLNEIITAYDFTGANWLAVEYYHYDQGDEETVGSDHVGHHNSDAVYYSCDNNTWYLLTSLGNVGTSWTRGYHVISDDADWCGTANSSFAIKWTQYDNYPVTSDGRALDDIKINFTISGGGTPEYGFWHNISNESFTSDMCNIDYSECWSNETVSINSTIGIQYAWCYHGTDTGGYTNSTSCENPFVYNSTEETTPESGCNCEFPNNYATDKEINMSCYCYINDTSWCRELSFVDEGYTILNATLNITKNLTGANNQILYGGSNGQINLIT